MSDPNTAESEILTSVILGTQATYRVIERQPSGLVRVATIEAPGLSAGFEFSITAEAAAAMSSSLEEAETSRSLPVTPRASTPPATST
jgi:hypothetical protein